MKVLGIGNAIVDVICKVEDSFLSENNLTKSTMKLVNEVEFKKLLFNLKIEEFYKSVKSNTSFAKSPASTVRTQGNHCLRQFTHSLNLKS